MPMNESSTTVPPRRSLLSRRSAPAAAAAAVCRSKPTLGNDGNSGIANFRHSATLTTSTPVAVAKKRNLTRLAATVVTPSTTYTPKAAKNGPRQDKCFVSIAAPVVQNPYAKPSATQVTNKEVSPFSMVSKTTKTRDVYKPPPKKKKPFKPYTKQEKRAWKLRHQQNIYINNNTKVAQEKRKREQALLIKRQEERRKRQLEKEKEQRQQQQLVQERLQAAMLAAATSSNVFTNEPPVVEIGDWNPPPLPLGALNFWNTQLIMANDLPMIHPCYNDIDQNSGHAGASECNMIHSPGWEGSSGYNASSSGCAPGCDCCI